MGIQIACATCGFSTRVKSRYQGKRVKCPKCQALIIVPAVEPAERTVVEIPEISTSRTAPPDKKAASGASGHNRFLIAAASGAAVVLLLGLGYYLGTQSGQNPQVTADRDGPPGSNSLAPPVESADPTGPSGPPASRQSEQPAEDQSPRPGSVAQSQPPTAGANGQASGDNTDHSTATPSPVAGQTVAPSTVIPTVPLERPLRQTIEFSVLPIEEPVTSMAMSDDHQYLVFSHQTAGQVTFYDVTSDQSAVAYTPSPRSILCRQGQVFVANSGEGTISVFSGAPDWKLTNQVDVVKPNIVHMSAPQTRVFDGRLIVTCHGDGNQASYRDSHVYEVDTRADRCKPISRAALASVSYDGKLIITQGSFNLSPSGGVSAYSYDEFIAGNAKPIFQGGIQQTPFVYQPYSGSYWFGDSVIFGGVPLAQVSGEIGPLVVPDLSQKVFYSLAKDRVIAHQLAAGLPEIGWKRAAYPPEFHEDFSRLSHFLHRRRSYLLDHPIALTRDEELSFYVLVAKGGVVLRASTSAFDPATAERSDEPEATLVQDRSASDAASGSAPAPPRTSPPAEIRAPFARLPKMVAVGEPLTFPIRPSPGTTVELMAALPGMSFTGDNEFRWIPTSDQIGVHKLKFRVQRADSVAFERPSIEVVPEELADSVGGDLTGLADFATLPLFVDRYSLEPGVDGKTLLLLQGDSLRRLGSDGISVVEELTLPNRYQLLAERLDVYVGVTKSPKPVLEVIDKQTLQVTASINLATAELRVLEISDLAVHPVERTSYVAIKHSIELPRYSVLVVDESQSDVVAAPVLGKWVVVSPDGQTLWTGYSDIYRQGTNFHINPDWRLIEIPDYGNVDMLLAWDLSNRLTLKGVVSKAGGNGYGIRLSADGRRVTYLSHVGTPAFSKNLVGFDAQDLAAPGVTYETKDRAVTTELAYHPFLPLVAVPGGTSAVLFDRETGKVLENRLLLTAAGLGETKVERLLFAPDGEHLVFVCSGGETGRYIRSVPLRLTSDDKRQRLQKPQPAPPAKPQAQGTRA